MNLGAWETTRHKSGCPRSLAFGHLGNHKPNQPSKRRSFVPHPFRSLIAEWVGNHRHSSVHNFRNRRVPQVPRLWGPGIPRSSTRLFMKAGLPHLRHCFIVAKVGFHIPIHEASAPKIPLRPQATSSVTPGVKQIRAILVPRAAPPGLSSRFPISPGHAAAATRKLRRMSVESSLGSRPWSWRTG